MTRAVGSVAHTLDFGDSTAPGITPAVSLPRPMLRLTASTAAAARRRVTARRLSGPDKYKVLDARRRHAQMKARRLLDLMERQENRR